MHPSLARLLRRLTRGRFPKVPATSRPPFLFVGEACTVDPTVQFREHEGQTITFADHVLVRRHCEFCGDITVGRYTRFNRDVYVRPHTYIGAYVSIGPFVRFITDSHEIGKVTRRAGKVYYDPISVGDGAWIGAGAIILGGVTIGRGAIVAAGAVVTHDVAPDTLVGGTPARLIRDLPPLESEPQPATERSPEMRIVSPDPDDEHEPSPQRPRPLRPAA